jgi:hypothetical protein
MNNFDYLQDKLPESNNSVILLSKYLNNSDIVLSNGLNYEQLRKIIHIIISDFFNYQLDPDQLSVLSDQLMILCKDFSTLRNSDLYQLLLDMAELEVCLRNNFQTVPHTLEKMNLFRNKSDL